MGAGDSVDTFQGSCLGTPGVLRSSSKVCYNGIQMEGRSLLARLNRDRIFWLIVGGVLLVYAVLQGNIVSFLVTMVALLLAVTVHECAHAWTADQLGDPTARLMGRVTLDPRAHLDPMGTAMMVITALTGMGIGWGKPVPVTPYRLRYGPRLGSGLVALSGPASNLLLAALLGLVGRLASMLWPTLSPLYFLLQFVVMTNIVIAVFNLLPIPPLDGHSVLLGLLSLSRSEWAWRVSGFLSGLRRHGPMILIAVIIVSQFLGLNLLGWLIGGPSRFFYRAVMGSGV